MTLDQVARRGAALAAAAVEERLAMIDAVMAQALVAASVQRGAGRVSATGPGVRRRAIEDSRLRFLGLLK